MLYLSARLPVHPEHRMLGTDAQLLWAASWAQVRSCLHVVPDPCGSPGTALGQQCPWGGAETALVPPAGQVPRAPLWAMGFLPLLQCTHMSRRAGMIPLQNQSICLARTGASLRGQRGDGASWQQREAVQGPWAGGRSCEESGRRSRGEEGCVPPLGPR